MIISKIEFGESSNTTKFYDENNKLIKNIKNLTLKMGTNRPIQFNIDFYNMEVE